MIAPEQKQSKFANLGSDSDLKSAVFEVSREELLRDASHRNPRFWSHAVLRRQHRSQGLGTHGEIFRAAHECVDDG